MRFMAILAVAALASLSVGCDVELEEEEVQEDPAQQALLAGWKGGAVVSGVLRDPRGIPLEDVLIEASPLGATEGSGPSIIKASGYYELSLQGTSAIVNFYGPALEEMRTWHLDFHHPPPGTALDEEGRLLIPLNLIAEAAVAPEPPRNIEAEEEKVEE